MLISINHSIPQSNPDNKPWSSFFDFVVVDAKKPLFFSQGTVIREVNKVSRPKFYKHLPASLTSFSFICMSLSTLVAILTNLDVFFQWQFFAMCLIFR